MKGNSQLIVIAICAALCTGMLHLLGVFDLQDKGLSGWNPNSMYNGVIVKDTNVYGISIVDRPSVGNTSRVTTSMSSVATGSIRSNKISALPSSKVISSSVSSSYVGTPLRTTSSASYRSFGGGGYAGGANNTFVFNQFKMAKSSSMGMSVMPNLSYVPAASSRVYSSAQMSGGAYSYSAPSMEGIAPRGINGRRNAGVGFDDIWSDWLWGLHDDGDGTGAWMYDSGDNYYYNSSKLREAFAAWFSSNSSSFQGMTEEEAWLLFLEWFAPKDSDGNLLDTDHNFRFPISDGLGVLMVLALLYAFVIYLKLRSKKVA